jgi:hypothetical protein
MLFRKRELSLSLKPRRRFTKEAVGPGLIFPAQCHWFSENEELYALRPRKNVQFMMNEEMKLCFGPFLASCAELCFVITACHQPPFPSSPVFATLAGSNSSLFDALS